MRQSWLSRRAEERVACTKGMQKLGPEGERGHDSFIWQSRAQLLRLWGDEHGSGIEPAKIGKQGLLDHSTGLFSFTIRAVGFP
jgi:hypothetical protein